MLLLFGGYVMLLVVSFIQKSVVIYCEKFNQMLLVIVFWIILVEITYGSVRYRSDFSAALARLTVKNFVNSNEILAARKTS